MTNLCLWEKIINEFKVVWLWAASLKLGFAVVGLKIRTKSGLKMSVMQHNLTLELGYS
jgi:hypothetical protein